jgi:hypothetical protein
MYWDSPFTSVLTKSIDLSSVTFVDRILLPERGVAVSFPKREDPFWAGRGVAAGRDG